MSAERLDLDAIEARANAATPGPWADGMARECIHAPNLCEDGCPDSLRRIVARTFLAVCLTLSCVKVPGGTSTMAFSPSGWRLTVPSG